MYSVDSGHKKNPQEHLWALNVSMLGYRSANTSFAWLIIKQQLCQQQLNHKQQNHKQQNQLL